jgi:hypothetical protein
MKKKTKNCCTKTTAIFSCLSIKFEDICRLEKTIGKGERSKGKVFNVYVVH